MTAADDAKAIRPILMDHEPDNGPKKSLGIEDIEPSPAVEAVREVFAEVRANAGLPPHGATEATSEIGDDLIAAARARRASPQPGVEAGGWVAISERWPDAEGDYLTWQSRYPHTLAIHRYTRRLGFQFYDDDCCWVVTTCPTHWRPLPPPPQQQQQDEGEV